jgi:C-terminal processing protease CtpA/Prc
MYPPQDEPFQHMVVVLERQVSGFGFKVIGGYEESSQPTIGGIVDGGAADLDGRLMVGDEITHVNGVSVVDSPHKDVIDLIGRAGKTGRVELQIRRKMPWPMSGPSQVPMGGGHMNHNATPIGPREVVIYRPNTQTSFGFVLQSNTLRTGCMICRLIPESPAEKCGQLCLYDELLVVNGVDVTQMDHGDIVGLIKGSSTTIKLVVQQPEDKDEILQLQQMTLSQDQHSMQPAMAYLHQHQRLPYHGEEVGPQISADLEGIEDEEILHIDIRRSENGFGFSIRGGVEYNSHLFVLRIAENGAADRDGRLKVGDELLEINGNSTEGMLHADAITIIKHGGEKVSLIVRRVPETGRYGDENLSNNVPAVMHRDGDYPYHHHNNVETNNRASSGSRELLNNQKSPATSNTHEKYARYVLGVF